MREHPPDRRLGARDRGVVSTSVGFFGFGGLVGFGGDAKRADASGERLYACHPVASAAASPVWFNCLGRGQVKPADYILTCADAGSVLDHLVWTRWTAQQAVATGVHELNNAIPNRAEGKFIDYPAVATLWRSEPVPGHRASRTSPGSRCATPGRDRPRTPATASSSSTRPRGPSC